MIFDNLMDIWNQIIPLTSVPAIFTWFWYLVPFFLVIILVSMCIIVPVSIVLKMIRGR